VEKLHFEEKLESDFLPFAQVEKNPIIEEWLFKKQSNSEFFMQAALRDRFCFLMTSAILRGQSLFRAELSDLCDFTFKTPQGKEILVLVIRVAIGKTNGLKTLYGRAIRNVDVRLCPVGSLGFYLFSRFHYANENLDFSSNEHWFPSKLLVEFGSKNSFDCMSDQAYAKTMKKSATN